jgi:hypothetical protein
MSRAEKASTAQAVSQHRYAVCRSCPGSIAHSYVALAFPLIGIGRVLGEIHPGRLEQCRGIPDGGFLAVDGGVVRGWGV